MGWMPAVRCKIALSGRFVIRRISAQCPFRSSRIPDSGRSAKPVVFEVECSEPAIRDLNPIRPTADIACGNVISVLPAYCHSIEPVAAMPDHFSSHRFRYAYPCACSSSCLTSSISVLVPTICQLYRADRRTARHESATSDMKTTLHQAEQKHC